MKGKTIFGLILIALATASGVYFINEKMKPGKIIPEKVTTFGNSVNNPIAINKANPGNIRDSLEVFQGEVPSPDSDFKSFSSMAYGFRAIIVILRTYYNKYDLHTLSEMIERWAPSTENDTDSYITFVASNAPFDADADMHDILFGAYNPDIKNILTCMTWREQGQSFIFNEDDIRQAFNLA